MIYWEKQKKVKALYEQYAKPVRVKYDLSPMEYSILLFLYRNPAYDTAASIVQTSQFTKSHVSSAIKGLEERKLVTKAYLDNNNKTIHLKLTDRASKILQEATAAIDQYIDCLFTGFSKEERQEMARYFDRICENADAKLRIMEEEKNRCTN